jgi:hypothetical protein
MPTLLTWALFVGSTAAGLVVALRALPPVERRILSAQKPWACDVCMSFWIVSIITIFVGASQGRELLLCAGPAYPLCLWVLRQITAPRGPLPELVEDP